jgi:aspartate-semialdehyde dehydrogenase
MTKIGDKTTAMNISITGGTGFVGQNLMTYLGNKFYFKKRESS